MHVKKLVQTNAVI